MMITFCLDSHEDWDDGNCMLLFAVRKAFLESVGFSPFELVFGYSVGGPFVKMLLLLYYMMWGYFRNKLTRACEIDTLKQSQDKMKQWYNRDTMISEYKPGEKGIVLLCYCLSIVIQYKLNILVIHVCI